MSTAFQKWQRMRNARHEASHAFMLWRSGLHLALKPTAVCVGVEYDGQFVGGFVGFAGMDVSRAIASGSWMDAAGKVDSTAELAKTLPEFTCDCIAFVLAGYAACFALDNPGTCDRVAAHHSSDGETVRQIIRDLLVHEGDAADSFIREAVSGCLHREVARFREDRALSDGIERLATWLYDRPNGRASWAELESFLSGSGVAQLPPEQTNNAPMELQNEKEITL